MQSVNTDQRLKLCLYMAAYLVASMGAMAAVAGFAERVREKNYREWQL